jgi:hypothetical protein
VILRRLEVDDYSCDEWLKAERGGPHGQDGPAIDQLALTWVSQFTSGKIEYQAIGMIERGYLGFDQLTTEGDFHSDTVGAFSDRYGCDYRMRIARLVSSGVLGNGGRCGPAGQ